MPPTRSPKVLALAVVVAVAAACADESGNKDVDSGDDIDAATLTWVTKPPVKVPLGDSFTASWTIETKGTLHITELRACKGDKPDCGSGGLSTFDETAFAEANGEQYDSTLELPTAGEWTIVAYCHVGEKPHTSEAVNVSVE